MIKVHRGVAAELSVNLLNTPHSSGSVAATSADTSVDISVDVSADTSTEPFHNPAATLQH